jgi:hypothetical protein
MHTDLLLALEAIDLAPLAPQFWGELVLNPSKVKSLGEASRGGDLGGDSALNVDR